MDQKLLRQRGRRCPLGTKHNRQGDFTALLNQSNFLFVFEFFETPKKCVALFRDHSEIESEWIDFLERSEMHDSSGYPRTFDASLGDENNGWPQGTGQFSLALPSSPPILMSWRGLWERSDVMRKRIVFTSPALNRLRVGC